MSGLVCHHGVTQQLLCCGQGLWSASGSGTVLCLGTKKMDPVYAPIKRSFFFQSVDDHTTAGGRCSSPVPRLGQKLAFFFSLAAPSAAMSAVES